MLRICWSNLVRHYWFGNPYLITRLCGITYQHTIPEPKPNNYWHSRMEKYKEKYL